MPPVVLLAVDVAARAVLGMLHAHRFFRGHLAVALDTGLDVGDVLLLVFQTVFFAPRQLARGHALVDAGGLAGLAVVDALGLALGRCDRLGQCDGAQRKDGCG